MSDAVMAGRAQFAFTIMFHYLFPILTMGLGTMIAVLKTLQLVRKDERYGVAARSAGETIFTTLGFMGIYALLGLIFLSLTLRLVGQGPSWDLEQLELKELTKLLEAEKDKDAKDKEAHV